MKRLTALLLAAIFITLHTGAVEPEISRQIDSIRKVLPTLAAAREPRPYADAYIALCILYDEAGDLQAYRAILDERIEAMRPLGDYHYAAALSDRLVDIYNYNRLDEFWGALPECLDYCRKNELWFRYGFCNHLAVLLEIEAGYYDRALGRLKEEYELGSENDSNTLVAIALRDMAYTYHCMGHIDHSSKLFVDAKQLLLHSDSGPDIVTLDETYYQMCESLRDAERHREALEVCKEWEEWTREHSDIIDRELDIYSSYAHIYGALGRFHEAWHYLRKAERVKALPNDLDRVMFTTIRARLYESEGRYDEALSAVDSLCRYYDSIGGTASKQTQMEIRGRIAMLSGKWELAANDYHDALALSRELEEHRVLDELHRLRTEYEVDKLEAQKRARERYLWLSAGIIVLLAGLLGVWMVYTRRIRRKNLSLFRQIQEMSRAEKEIEKVLESVEGTGLSREMKLFRELSRLMHSDMLFRDQTLDRRSVAGMLGTNEKYLANAVHEGAGTTFAGWISDLRLSYSLELLTGNDDATLEEIAEESGHGSYSPFFRAFVKKYGMSPSKYRELSRSNIVNPEVPYKL
jgi:AraC-like DNA-binding protein